MKSFFVITLVLFSCLCLVGVTQAVSVSKEGMHDEAFDPENILDAGKLTQAEEDKITEIRKQVLFLQESVAEITRSFSTLELVNKNPSMMAEILTPDTGVIYTRWGNDKCPRDAELIYSGSIGGAYYTHTGSGSNYLCMPDKPIYDEVASPSYYDDRSLLYSSEYQVHDGPSRIRPMHDQTPTCAVCRAPSGRTSKLMIPARNVCPSQEWRLEYAGYIMADKYTHKRTEFICVDREMVPKAGTWGNQDGALLFITEVRCLVGGGLDCGPYVDGNEITCAVCTI